MGALRAKKTRRTKKQRAIAIQVDAIALRSGGARPLSRKPCGLLVKK
jgi:hypothetical protein